MPVTIYGNAPRSGSEDRVKMGRGADGKVKEDFSRLYRPFYPEGLNLTPYTETHDSLVEEILVRAEDSHRYMVSSNKFEKWRKIDRTLSAFIDTDIDEKAIQRQDIRKPISIVVPESYANLDVILTYMTTVFGNDPMFKYEGIGPEDTIGAILMEKIVSLQVQKGKALLGLHTQWRDAFSYGIGIVHIPWRVRIGRRSVNTPTGIFDQNGNFIPTGL